MNPLLIQTVKNLGEGRVLESKLGKLTFKLDSYPGNPIIKPQHLGLTWYEGDKLRIGAVFNPGAVCFEEKIILLPRCHKNYQRKSYFDKALGVKRYYLENYISEVWVLRSANGIKFERFQNIVIRGDGKHHKDFTYGIEDIRIIKYGEKFLLLGCGKVGLPFIGKNSDRIAIYCTNDFINITYHGIVSSFYSRNAIPLFVGEKAYAFLRFNPNIHLALLEGGIEQLLNPSKYTKYWDKIYEKRNRNLLLEVGKYPHEKEKIGPSIPLIKTEKGWLMVYHAVGEIGINITREYGLNRPIKRSYSICAALLDLDEPTRVICRTRSPIFIPSNPYELEGNEQYPVDVPYVVFPVGGVTMNDKLLIYCGAGDKYITLLSCSLSNLVDYLLRNCEV